MAGGVTFNYTTWALRFPELAAYVGEPLAQLYFDEAATLYVDNSATTIIDANMLPLVLNLATAHLAAMNAINNGQLPSALVGRIAGATEGSVSVQTAPLAGEQPGRDWWAQTRYGFQVWQALSGYMSAFLIPGPRRGFGVVRRTGPAWAR